MKQGQNGNYTNGANGASSVADEEMTRLMIQALGDMGYTTAMHALSEASGVRIESPVVLAFRQAMLAGDWDLALSALQQLSLTHPSGHKAVLFLIYEQKFLEQLERRQASPALKTLRQGLAPLKHDMERLHFLSTLLMTAPADLQQKAGWSGSSGDSRAVLLRRVSRFISPGSMMPERRLAALLNDARQRQARECLYHTGSQPVSLLAPYHCCDRDQFPVRIVKELRDHQDEIWHVAYSPRATYFASAARDGEIIVYNTARWEIKNRLHARALRMGSQAAGVSHIAFSADEELLLSCQQDNAVCVWDLRTGLLLNQISHLHKEPPSAAVFVPQADPGPQRFLTGGLDKKIHLLSSTGEVLTTWDSGRIYDLKCTPDGRSFATIDTAGQLSVFDLQSLSMVHSLHIQDGELTSLAISADSQRLLVHCKPPDTKGELRKARLMEYSIPDCDLVHTFVNGPIQSQFIVRSGYGGNEEQFVLSGSEYGRVFIWHRTSRTLLESIEGHAQCVGSVSWRPGAMAEWASGSDDGTVKIWGVQREETNAQSDTGHE